MERTPFDGVVCIRIGPQSTLRQVKTASGACECLIDWPQAERGPLYRDAVHTCNAVVSGESTAHDARSAFIAAAEEAGFLICC